MVRGRKPVPKKKATDRRTVLGKFVASRKLGKPDKRTTKKWLRTAADERAMSQGCWFSEGAGDHVIEFSRHFRHTKGRLAGQVFEPLEWQANDLIKPLFGWRKPDGRRRFEACYCEVPKKNGKSFLCSILSLYLFGADGEVGSMVYVAASDKDQANIVYREASLMAQESDLFEGYITPADYRKVLTLPSLKSELRVLAGDAFRSEGLDIHGLIFDELHAQRGRELFESLEYGGEARREPLQIAITTAGYDRTSICYEQHKMAKAILEGTDDETIDRLPLIYGAERGQDWKDPETWASANPSWGVTIEPERFARKAREAIEVRSKENSFRRYRLNEWTEQEFRWIQRRKWDACRGTVAMEQGAPCFGGLDMSSTDDLTAFVLVFPQADLYYVEPYFFVPGKSAAERERKDGVPYLTWGRQGFLTLTEGTEVDHKAVREKVVELTHRYRLIEIGYDPWQSEANAQAFREKGLACEKITQSYASMNEPCRLLDTLIERKELIHPGHPVLDWNADNVVAEEDLHGRMRVAKKKGAEKVDGMAALVMALARAMLQEVSASYYETHGIDTFEDWDW